MHEKNLISFQFTSFEMRRIKFHYMETDASSQSGNDCTDVNAACEKKFQYKTSYHMTWKNINSAPFVLRSCLKNYFNLKHDT